MLLLDRAIPVDEDIVQSELEDEGLELLLDVQIGFLRRILRKYVKRSDAPAIHVRNVSM